VSALRIAETAPGTIAVFGDARVDNAAVLRDALLARLDAQPRLDVDLLNVTDVDAATLQVMLLVRREAERQDKPLRWLGYDERLARLATLLGLDAELSGPLCVIWE
jgi:ABC-type transporter Mla MlaB component